MAEIAAAALAAEQVVATGVEAAAAAAIAAPTLPLKISLTHLPSPVAEPAHHQALARSHHTLTVLANNNKAFIFGGLDASGALCAPGIHTITLPTFAAPTSPQTPADGTTTTANTNNNHHRHETYSTAYTCYPPFPLQDAATGEVLVPAPRARHAACAWGATTLLVHGGRGADGRPLADEANCLWQWDSARLSWRKLRGDTQLGAAMAPRYGHWMVGEQAQGFVVVVGGQGGDGVGMEREVWMYDFHAFAWTALPAVPGRPLAAAYAGGRVYVVAEDGDGGGLGGVVHFLDLKTSTVEREKPGALKWETVAFPANPLAPGPKPRAGGALVPLSTGFGREYLVYMFGCSDKGAKEYYSDVWTLQLPAHGHNLAAAKDKIRQKLPGMESGEFSWAEAEIVPTEQMSQEGKMHPGPRGLFGADSCLDGQGAVFWGGKNAKGETEGDGWILRLAHGYADNDRWE
ncbi:hypothetical protein BT67DRAFT_425021 [Trichocladium antarcticum]|uniref:Uncharacterized protein n=1 Tax=Trichocladium antarcticum TaxID=1450529 RepID=A0AAN6UH69_9PEZI|nr:hypothetical protein BT67DRAFT_425021 [Trichocladium antarcticum]